MSFQDLQAKLGTYASLVIFEQVIDCIIVKPRAFLPKEKWNAINKLCREEGGKWVPIPGATGHWEVPLLKQDMFVAKPTRESLILDLEDLLKQGYKKLTVKWEK